MIDTGAVRSESVIRLEKCLVQVSIDDVNIVTSFRYLRLACRGGRLSRCNMSS